MAHKLISLRNIRQLTQDSCGAACAEMVLHELGRVKVSQKDLFEKTHSFKTKDAKYDWSSSPDGIVHTLNSEKPSEFNGRFKLIARSNYNTVSRKLVWNIYHFNTPCLALVFGDQHWIVINGYWIRKNPMSPDDTSYEIVGLWIKDPEDNTHHFVDWAPWQSNYMAQPVSGGYWKRKYLAICDPPKKSTEKIVSTSSLLRHNKKQLPAKSENPTNETVTSFYTNNQLQIKNSNVNLVSMKKNLHGLIVIPQVHPLLQKFIGEKKASSYALWSLKDRGFMKFPFLKKTLSNVTAGPAQLVKSLHKKNDYYYIVPIISSGKKIHSLVSVGAMGEVFKEASFVTAPQNTLFFKPLNKYQILDQILKFIFASSKSKKENKILKLLDASIKKGKVSRENLIIVDPVLVWRPCLQSFSPYLPFYKIAIRRHNFFVRIDGRVFTKLTKAHGA